MFLYLLAIVPSIWLLELDRINRHLQVVDAAANGNTIPDLVRFFHCPNLLKWVSEFSPFSDLQMFLSSEGFGCSATMSRRHHTNASKKVNSWRCGYICHSNGKNSLEKCGTQVSGIGFCALLCKGQSLRFSLFISVSVSLTLSAVIYSCFSSWNQSKNWFL